MPSFGVNPFKFLDGPYLAKSKDFVKLASLIWYSPDRQTHRQQLLQHGDEL